MKSFLATEIQIWGVVIKHNLFLIVLLMIGGFLFSYLHGPKESHWNAYVHIKQGPPLILHFTIPANGDFNTTLIALGGEYTVNQVVFQLDFPRNRILEMANIDFLDGEQQVLHHVDFYDLDHLDWSFISLKRNGFQLKEESFERLEFLIKNPDTFLAYATTLHIENPQPSDLSPLQLKALYQLKDKPFKTRDSFDEALKEINIFLNPTEGRVLRSLSKLALYQKDPESLNPMLVSPLLSQKKVWYLRIQSKIHPQPLLLI